MQSKQENGTQSKQRIFEQLPVPWAVLTLALPTVISQVVTIVYNMADTFFIGQMGNPHMVAAVSLVYPWFNLLTALGNLFGIGGSSLISRLMGVSRTSEIRNVSAFSFYAGASATALFSVCSLCFREPILRFLGASLDTIGYAADYMFWVVVLGGIPTMLGLTMGHLLRGEGYTKQSSFGMMLGGVVNVILDPILIFGFQLGVSGAAIATVCSNLLSVLFFLWTLRRLQGRTQLSIHPKHFTFRYIGSVFSVGLASALATTLANASNMVIVRLSANYGDIPLAAYGIVKKIDMVPLQICHGLCQGVMPLIGYNYAAQNYERMKRISIFSWKLTLAFSAACVALFQFGSSGILNVFIRETETAALGARFLRVASLAVPLTAINAQIGYMLQAMGKGLQATVSSTCRQGVLNIPLLFLMNYLIGLQGIIWAQPIMELVMLPISFCLYFFTVKRATQAAGSDAGTTKRQ